MGKRSKSAGLFSQNPLFGSAFLCFILVLFVSEIFSFRFLFRKSVKIFTDSFTQFYILIFYLEVSSETSNNSFIHFSIQKLLFRNQFISISSINTPFFPSIKTQAISQVHTTNYYLTPLNQFESSLSSSYTHYRWTRRRLLLPADSSIFTTRLQHVTFRLRSGLCSTPIVFLLYN